MKYLLTKEESEILYPGLRDMPKERISEDNFQYPQLKGEGNPNWKDGISLDRNSYGKEWRKKPEVIKYQREYQRKYCKTPKRKAQVKAYIQTPERKARRKELRERPEVKEYHKQYRQRPEYKEYQRAYRAKKRQEKLTISSTCL
jgi:hypothetical protein